MKCLLALLLALLAAGPAFGQTPAPGQSVVQTDNVRAELLADVTAVKPGLSLSGSGCARPSEPKWHTYWKNPGEFRPPDRAHVDPAGGRGGRRDRLAGTEPLRHRRRHQLRLPRGTRCCWCRITPPDGLSGRSVTSNADANWLVCENVCIPEDGNFELKVPARSPRRCRAPPATRAIFDKAHQHACRRKPVARAPSAWPRQAIRRGWPITVQGLSPTWCASVDFFHGRDRVRSPAGEADASPARRRHP